MILGVIAEKLKCQSEDDVRGRHFEATLILQAASWHLRYLLSGAFLCQLRAEAPFRNPSVWRALVRARIPCAFTAAGSP
jgi:hypothetical protein